MNDLRDQFAMAAMNGLISNGWMRDMENIAEVSYRQADAMLTARHDVVILERAEFERIHGEIIECKELIQALKGDKP